ncbi:hypothetical protein ACCD09_05275, partial [Variovorax sp. Varisp62]
MVQPSDRSSGSSPGVVDNAVARRIRMLRTAMGPEIAAALADPEVVEVLLNPDGSLWVDRLGSQGARHRHGDLLHQLLQPREGALR